MPVTFVIMGLIVKMKSRSILKKIIIVKISKNMENI